MRTGCLLVALLASACVEAHGRMTTPRTLSPGEAIADAIGAAAEGEVIALKAGRYPLNLVLAKSVTLRAAGDGEVVLDGQGRGSVVRVTGAKKSLRLENVVLTGGAGQGAALAATGLSTIELVGVTVRGNHAGRNATVHIEAGTLTLEHCRVVDNDGDFGAALLVDGVASVQVRRSLIAGNRATTSAVAVRDLGELTLEHSTIAANHAPLTLELRATPGRTPTTTLIDSIVASDTVAIGNGPRLPGQVVATRSLVDGGTQGQVDLGAARSGKAGFVGAGGEPFRPGKGSAAIGLAQDGGVDLTGLPLGRTAGALAPAP